MSSRTSRSVLIGIAATLMAAAAEAGNGPGRIAWSVQTDGFNLGFVNPAIGPDGTVYTTNGGMVTAVSPEGAVLWTVAPADGQISVGPDGTIYTGAGNVVRALNPDGSVKWTFPIDSFPVIGGPAVGPDSNVYAANDADDVGVDGLGAFSLDPQGNLRWSNEGSPPVSDDEGLPHEIVFSGDQWYMAAPPAGGFDPPALWAFDLDGDQPFVLLGSCQGQPVVSPLNGDLVTGNTTCQAVQAYDPQSGSLTWSEDPASSSSCSGLANVAVGPDGNIYTAFCYRAFWSLAADGTQRWFIDDADLYYRMDHLGVAPDNSVVLELGVDFDEPTGRVRALSTADAALLWELALPDAGALGISEPVFDAARQRAYFNAHNSAVGTTFLYAVDLVGPPSIPGDVNGDGAVNVLDFLQLLGAWGACDGCPEDIDGDGFVGTTDFLTLLANWSE